jgi:hypothetical protein
MSLFKPVNGLIIGLLALIMISYGLKLYAQQAVELTPPPKPVESKPPVSKAPTVAASPAFSVGERLLYNISWSNFSTAARLEMEVSDRGKFYGQDGFQIRTKVETVGRVRSLFGEVDNQYTTYINANNAVPFRLVNSIRQGQKQIEETIVLDQARQQALLSEDRTIPIAAGTYDIPSLVYGMRLRPWPQKGKQKFVTFYNNEVIEVHATFKNKDRLTTPAGTYNAVCLKFSPQKRYSDLQLSACFSDDKQKLPLLVTAKLPFGNVRAELASANTTSRPSSPLAELNTPTDESGNLPPNERRPFVVGERLNYDIAWGNFVSVGKASFEVRQQGTLGNNRVYVFHGEATSTGALKTLIDVNDQVSSFVLVDKLVPIRTDLNLREGKRTKQMSITYNPAANSALLSTGTAVTIRPGTLDLVSLLYAVRSCELRIGGNHNFPFLDANGRLQMVTVIPVKREAIGGPMGTQDAIQLNVLAAGTPQMLLAQVWISDNLLRLPLYMATRTKFGELRFQMTSANNTK